MSIFPATPHMMRELGGVGVAPDDLQKHIGGIKLAVFLFELGAQHLDPLSDFALLLLVVFGHFCEAFIAEFPGQIILVAYLVVRRTSFWNNTIDTLSMLPYIMPGSVIGIALVIAFGSKPLALTGTLTIMIISLVIRRMPYTIRSATATLMQIPLSVEEAAISLGASKMKTFFKVTVPMMSNGILSGAILSWVSIVTELSSAIILYNNKTITLTMSAYVAINRGNYGLAAAFSAVLTIITVISLLIYMKVSKTEDIAL